MVWVLVAATAVGLTVAWAQDHSFELGRASGVAEATRQDAAYAAEYEAGYAAGERHEERRQRHVVEVDTLPAGVDREVAAEAEERGEAFAFLSPRPEIGCSVMLRLPAGTVVGVPDAVTEVGLTLDTRYWSCDAPSSNERLPGGPPAPTVTDRPMRWERAIIGGDLFAYRVGDTIRLDTDRCSGFTIPLPVPAGGVAVPETAPSVSRSSVCGNKPR
ncbi:hypothetical protein [Mycolicibacter virginiensis]|uniref:hypothetical protein n=1 Tax=Mycolicibacter virginiensis TaxID=1795032 RepID=UPI001F045111|nr:hypothetical protein [Mycolicibacter virginiensis]ULP45878.1 hypothetical protein MJO54_13465 [Mycolicibacter virginiensis]